ncbi:MAG: PilZ domain-containing protein [Proteobacteria bacterium]|nr:PilZ domain-containing protein [Pseudomonadota bacterium]
MYFKVLLEGGHVGAGKSFEMVRYFEAENAIVLLKYLESYPALKSKSRGGGITLVKPVSKDEYLAKKDLETNDPYKKRQHVRFDIHEKFILESVSKSLKIEGMTFEYSGGGIGLKYSGKSFRVGEVFFLTVEALGLRRKKVRIAWCRSLKDGCNVAGLKWL